MVINPAHHHNLSHELRTSCLIKFATGEQAVMNFESGWIIFRSSTARSKSVIICGSGIGMSVGGVPVCTAVCCTVMDVDPGLVALGGDVVACGLG